jgi:hypothetical protein
MNKTNLIIIIMGLMLSSILLPGISAASDSTSDLINYINQSGGIPIKVTTTSSTNWTQFVISLVIGSFMLIFFFGSITNI